MTERLHFHFSLSCIGEGNGNPLQCSCLENPRDGGAWWTVVYGVAQSWTRLKRLSSSSSRVAIIKNPKNYRCWWKCWEIGTFIYCWWKHKMVQLPWKPVWWLLKKCQQNCHTSSNSTLRYTSKELKTGTLANTCACMFITALFTVAKGRNNPNFH